MGRFADALGRTSCLSGDRDALTLFGVPSMGRFADALARAFGDRDALALYGVKSMGGYADDIGPAGNADCLLGKDEA